MKTLQRQWIGRSEGAEIEFALEKGGTLKVFTTRPDTLMGVTYMAVAPEHPLVESLARHGRRESEVKAFSERTRKLSKIARSSDSTPKEGVMTGSYAIHPLTQELIPVYVTNFVLMEYGTGALMAVPAHDTRDHAFAQAHKLPIKQVIRPADRSPWNIQAEAFTTEGVLIHSGRFDGLDSEKAKREITAELEKKSKGKSAVNYRLKDWGLSRQRYWGAPIPMVYCQKCGIQPVPREELPVVLPYDVEFTGEGGSPLAKHPKFTSATCPKCKSPSARRETDTMDTFMESSWYYLKYASRGTAAAGPLDQNQLAYWLGVDQYIGGIEHATMHLLYFRFFHKALRDMGYLPKSLAAQDLNEPVRKLMNQGIVYKDGAKMSKSKGNVVEPDSLIQKYGADTARVFSMFAAPPEKILEWSDQGVEGASRFLARVWRIVEKYESLVRDVAPYSGAHKGLSQESSRKLRAKVHQTITKVETDFDKGYQFNTAIAAIMELVNEIYAYNVVLGVEESRAILREALEVTVRLLHPFAPHLTEELWEVLGGHERLVDKVLPHADPEALVKDILTIAIQVNGKLRGTIQVAAALEKDKVIEQAQVEPKVVNHLGGKEITKTIYVPGKLVNFIVK